MPAISIAGSSITFTLTALDSSNNIVTGYTGTVHFSLTDTGAGSVVPPNYTFVPADGGMHVFTAGANLVTAGVQTFTAFDTALRHPHCQCIGVSHCGGGHALCSQC